MCIFLWVRWTYKVSPLQAWSFLLYIAWDEVSIQPGHAKYSDCPKPDENNYSYIIIIGSGQAQPTLVVLHALFHPSNAVTPAYQLVTLAYQAIP